MSNPFNKIVDFEHIFTPLAIEKLTKLGGSGGLIGVDRNGTLVLPMNTPGMYRASFTANDDEPNVKIFADE